MRILLVDDDAMLGRSMLRTLRNADRDLSWDADARAALDRISHGERFDVVLCDVNMPELDGITFAQRAFAIDAGLAGRLVAITGGTTRHSEEELERLGVRILEKPFDAATLETVIGAYGPR